MSKEVGQNGVEGTMYRVKVQATRKDGKKATIAGIVCGVTKHEAIEEAMKIAKDMCECAQCISSIKFKSVKEITHDFMMIHKDSTIAKQGNANYEGVTSRETEVKREDPMRGLLEFIKHKLIEKREQMEREKSYADGVAKAKEDNACREAEAKATREAPERDTTVNS